MFSRQASVFVPAVGSLCAVDKDNPLVFIYLQRIGASVDVRTDTPGFKTKGAGGGIAAGILVATLSIHPAPAKF